MRQKTTEAFGTRSLIQMPLWECVPSSLLRKASRSQRGGGQEGAFDSPRLVRGARELSREEGQWGTGWGVARKKAGSPCGSLMAWQALPPYTE